MLMIIGSLILVGLCFGSFVNALVWRVHKQSRSNGSKSKTRDKKYSIVFGRSMCTHCSHELGVKDLLPVISWLALGGKCRYCKKQIHWQYPVVEALTAVLFVISYVFWPRELTGYEIGLFGLWLVAIVGFMALIVYDLRWMLLPNRIVFPLYGVGLITVILRVLKDNSFEPLAMSLAGVLVGGGIFYILFEISKGRWIGGGDVKLGFLLGALVGTPVLAMFMLFLASSLGTLLALPLLATKKVGRGARIPFGPFLIIATLITVLFGQNIVDWYLEISLITSDV